MNLMSLPFEMLEEIYVRADAVTRYALKQTCKLWYEVSQSAQIYTEPLTLMYLQSIVPGKEWRNVGRERRTYFFLQWNGYLLAKDDHIYNQLTRTETYYENESQFFRFRIGFMLAPWICGENQELIYITPTIDYHITLPCQAQEEYVNVEGDTPCIVTVTIENDISCYKLYEWKTGKYLESFSIPCFQSCCYYWRNRFYIPSDDRIYVYEIGQTVHSFLIRNSSICRFSEGRLLIAHEQSYALYDLGTEKKIAQGNIPNGDYLFVAGRYLLNYRWMRDECNVVDVEQSPGRIVRILSCPSFPGTKILLGSLLYNFDQRMFYQFLP